jgi:DNA-binding response OmpR family regulator
MPIVLIVEDDIYVSDIISTAVRRRWPGVHVVVTASGYSAVGLVRAVPLAAVVIDQRLVDVDGLKVCQSLRQFSTVPIVLIAADGGRATRERAASFGVNAVLGEDYGLNDIVDALEPFLRAGALDTEGSAGN